MKCHRCDRKAVYYRRYEGKGLCKRHFCESIEKRAKTTLSKNELIQKGDRVVIALSGGKDSSALTYILNNIFKEVRGIELFALTIDEGIEGYRSECVEIAKALCKRLRLKHHVFSFKEEFGKTLDDMKKEQAKACTYCGVFRRYVLNKAARELKATKLATGHNLDDEAQGILMNFFKGDINRLVRMGAKPMTRKDKKFVLRVKPFRDIPEKEIGAYCLLKGLELRTHECPYVKDSFRDDVRRLLNRMENKYPGSKYEVVRTYDNIEESLKSHARKDRVKRCKKCGEPTSQSVCKTCKLKATI